MNELTNENTNEGMNEWMKKSLLNFDGMQTSIYTHSHIYIRTHLCTHANTRSDSRLRVWNSQFHLKCHWALYYVSVNFMWHHTPSSSLHISAHICMYVFINDTIIKHFAKDILSASTFFRLLVCLFVCSFASYPKGEYIPVEVKNDSNIS